MARLLRIPAVPIALAAMVAAQVDMVAVMTMTPLYLSMHGQGLAMIGGVLSVHILGMFALSPLTGRLADRWGGRRVIAAGVGALALATLLAAISPLRMDLIEAPAMFVLGYGWNLCFVGGSSLLSKDVPEDAQTSLQGSVDAVVWTVSALASLASGGMLAAWGYPVLAIVAGLVVGLPLAALLRPARAANPSSSETTCRNAAGVATPATPPRRR